MLRRLLINEQPSFVSIGYSHQQLWRVPRGTANRHSQFPEILRCRLLFIWLTFEVYFLFIEFIDFTVQIVVFL